MTPITVILVLCFWIWYWDPSMTLMKMINPGTEDVVFMGKIAMTSTNTWWNVHQQSCERESRFVTPHEGWKGVLIARRE